MNLVTVNPLILSAGRVSASEEQEEVAVLPCQYYKQKATELVLSNLLCQKLNLLEGNERNKLETLRSKLLLKGVELPIITDKMVSDLTIGKCEETINALTANITGNQSVASLSRDLVNESTINSLLSNIVEAIDTILVTNTDFITRQIETFDSDVQVANARIDAVGLCPLYYFDPAGKRIRIPDINNCVVSINGILLSFEKNGERYIPLYNQRTKAFIGYHKELDFNRNATPTSSSNTALSAPMGLLSQWIRNTESPAENSKMNRWISFIEENKERPGVIQNYSDQTFIEVKLLFAQLPETVFDELEGSESYYLFDLLKIKQNLQAILDSTNAQLVFLTQIFEAPESVCLEESSAICKVFNCVYNKIVGYQKRDLLNTRIPLPIRKKLLTLLSQSMLTSGTLPGSCSFASDGEGIVISLLQTTPEPDRKAILDHLYSAEVNTDSSPLKSFITKIDGGNFDDLMLILSDWVTTYYPSQESWVQILERQDRAKRSLLVLGDWSLGSTQTMSVVGGKTLLHFNITVLGNAPILKPNIDALEYVVVKFTKDFTIGATTYHAGEIAKIPALLCYLIMNKQKNQSIATAGKYTAYALGAVVGVSQIMAASTALEMTLAIIDMGMLATDFIMNEVLAERLSQTQEGKVWLDNFNKFTLIYGAGRGLTELAGLSREVRNSASVLNDAEAIDITTNLTAKVVQASGVLDNAFLEGWSVERVLAYPKGQRPPIETYMRPFHKSNQLAKFKSEGGEFIIKERH